MQSMPSPDVAGLVLAGGRSRRFGADKAIQTLAGETLLARAAGALGRRCARVAVSAGSGDVCDLAASLGLAALSDDSAHASGPLAGLCAGLQWAARAGYARLAVTPCDTPLVTAEMIGRLIEAAAPSAFAETADGPQALTSVWPTSLAAGLAARLAAGEHPAVRRYLVEIGAVAVRFDDAGAFRNANTREDLDAIARALEARG